MKPPGLSPVIYSTPSIPGRDSSNKVLYSSKEKCPWFFMGIRTYTKRVLNFRRQAIVEQKRGCEKSPVILSLWAKNLFKKAVKPLFFRSFVA
jgi:hypothetical protein